MSTLPLTRTPTLRSVGWWMTVIAALYLLVSAAIAAAAPVSFAHSLGLPLASTADDGFPVVYATRTTVIALLALILALRQEIAILSILVLLATVLPLTDAVVVATHHAGAPTAVKHLASAVYLLATWILLRHHLHRSRRERYGG